MAQLELRAEQLSAAVSDALVHQAGEQRRRYDELTPLGVERGGRRGGNCLFERSPLLLELCDVLTDSDKHLAISRKLRFVAHRFPMTGNHDCTVSRDSEICISCLDHSFDVPASRVVDKRINTVPVRVGNVKNIRLGERDRNIAVRMRRTVMLESEGGPIQLEGFV